LLLGLTIATSAHADGPGLGNLTYTDAEVFKPIETHPLCEAHEVQDFEHDIRNSGPDMADSASASCTTSGRFATRRASGSARR